MPLAAMQKRQQQRRGDRANDQDVEGEGRHQRGAQVAARSAGRAVRHRTSSSDGGDHLVTERQVRGCIGHGIAGRLSHLLHGGIEGPGRAQQHADDERGGEQPACSPAAARRGTQRRCTVRPGTPAPTRGGLGRAGHHREPRLCLPQRGGDDSFLQGMLTRRTRFGGEIQEGIERARLGHETPRSIILGDEACKPQPLTGRPPRPIGTIDFQQVLERLPVLCPFFFCRHRLFLVPVANLVRLVVRPQAASHLFVLGEQLAPFLAQGSLQIPAGAGEQRFHRLVRDPHDAPDLHLAQALVVEQGQRHALPIG